MLLSMLQTVQCGVGWDMLWCLLRGHYLYFWNYPEEVTQKKVGWCVTVWCQCEVKSEQMYYVYRACSLPLVV